MELPEETFFKMHGFDATGDTHGRPASGAASTHIAMTIPRS